LRRARAHELAADLEVLRQPDHVGEDDGRHVAYVPGRVRKLSRQRHVDSPSDARLWQGEVPTGDVPS